MKNRAAYFEIIEDALEDVINAVERYGFAIYKISQLIDESENIYYVVIVKHPELRLVDSSEPLSEIQIIYDVVQNRIVVGEWYYV